MFVFTSLCLTKAWSFAGPGHVISRYTPGITLRALELEWAGIAPGAPEYSDQVEGAARYSTDVYFVRRTAVTSAQNLTLISAVIMDTQSITLPEMSS
jgi:hypothetical protein